MSRPLQYSGSSFFAAVQSQASGKKQTRHRSQGLPRPKQSLAGLSLVLPSLVSSAPSCETERSATPMFPCYSIQRRVKGFSTQEQHVEPCSQTTDTNKRPPPTGWPRLKQPLACLWSALPSLCLPRRCRLARQSDRPLDGIRHGLDKKTPQKGPCRQGGRAGQDGPSPYFSLEGKEARPCRLQAIG